MTGGAGSPKVLLWTFWICNCPSTHPEDAAGLVLPSLTENEVRSVQKAESLLSAPKDQVMLLPSPPLLSSGDFVLLPALGVPVVQSWTGGRSTFGAANFLGSCRRNSEGLGLRLRQGSCLSSASFTLRLRPLASCLPTLGALVRQLHSTLPPAMC